LKGDQVALAVQLVTLAQDAVVWTRIGGPDAALATVRKRSASAYQPRMAERFCAEARTILAGLDEDPSWESVLALGRGERNTLSDAEFDRSCEALADFADIKSPYAGGHSPAFAALAPGAGRRCGPVEADATALRRAGLLHDIGRVGVSAGIWAKEGALSEREWEQVRLHAYYTDRILARPEPLRLLGALASQHHERMDGSGYHRASPAKHCRQRPASWAPPMRTRRGPSRAPTASPCRRSKPRTNCVARFGTADWMSTPFRPCWPRPGTTPAAGPGSRLRTPCLVSTIGRKTCVQRR
jgi:hypothetical protein